MELDKLQEEAYYDVLMAFHAETSSISSERIMIVHDLVKELKVCPKSFTGIEIGIRTHPLITQIRNIEKEISELESLQLLPSDEKEKQKVIPEETEPLPLESLREKAMPPPNLPPPNMPEEKAELLPSDKKEKQKVISEETEPRKKDMPPPKMPEEKAELLASDEKEKQKAIPEETEPLPLESLGEKDKPPPNLPEETEPLPLESLREKDMPPPKIPEKKPESSSPSSWGQVSPESLVDKHIHIRLPDEDIYTKFYIKAYNPRMETHQLVSSLSQNDVKDPCDWVDLRQIPVEDTKWLCGHPGYPTPNCSLKPGETILNTTSTTGDKRELEKVETLSLTQFLNKENEEHSKQGMDKGKSIAYD